MYVPNDSGLAGLGGRERVQKIRAEHARVRKFGPGPDRDACMIRKGYQKTGRTATAGRPGSIGEADPIAALIP